MERLDENALDIRCPDCGRTVTKTLGWLKLRRSMNCTWCGTLIPINQEGLKEDLKRAELAFGQLAKHVGKP